MKINIIGLGYVGQTLAAVLADVGYKVYGSEIDDNVLKGLKNGNSHVHEPGLNTLIKKHLDKNLFIGKPNEMYKNEADVFIIAVTSPVDKITKKPNTEFVENAIKEIKKFLKPGQTIILRSTVPVGTTRNVVKPLLEKSGLKAGKDFYLSFAPERTIEGNALKELRALPQIIGGIDDSSVDIAAKIFRKVTPTIVCVSSLETAELVKLLDNSYRDLRFAYTNQIAKYCEKAGINAFEVIMAANQGYTRNDIPLPSPGVGGACLSKDPYILVYCAKKVNENLSLVSIARNINESIPQKIVERLKKEETLVNKKVFVVGFAFKGFPETNDIRESPTLYLIEHLKKENAQIIGFDPTVEDWKIKSLDVEYVDNMQDGLNNADIAIFMTNHRSFFDLNVKELFSKMKKNATVYDGWSLFKKHEIEELGIKYKGVGIG
jgi:nucleotide sugar dehydrogenase